MMPPTKYFWKKGYTHRIGITTTMDTVIFTEVGVRILATSIEAPSAARAIILSFLHQNTLSSLTNLDSLLAKRSNVILTIDFRIPTAVEYE